MNTLDYFSDKGLVQGQSGDPHTDKGWEDLQGKERWNFLIYSRTNHPIEFEGIKVKLSYEITNKTILQNGNTSEMYCTKKSLQEVVSWLIDEYTEDASAMYERFGSSRPFGPILLKELLKTNHDMETVEICIAFYPPDQV